jgi:hypothetical protein
LNISISISEAAAAEWHLAEEQGRILQSTLNKLKSQKFNFGTQKAVSKRVGQYFEQLRILVKRPVGKPRRRWKDVVQRDTT